MYGAAAFGEPGAAHALRMVIDDLVRAMMMLGAPTPRALRGAAGEETR